MKAENVSIDFLGHSGFLITTQAGKKIVIDPYNISDKVAKVDVILITHNHYDHCSIKDIEKLVKKGTIILMPADAQSKIMKISDVEMQIVEVGDRISVGNVKIEAMPAYNTDKDFHPKREGWLGYVVSVENTTIYHAGDTDKIPEMEKLTGYGKHGHEFIALLPVSGKFVMNAEEAAEAASLINPDLAIPMHYGAGVAGTLKDAEDFQEFCKEIGVKTQILERI